MCSYIARYFLRVKGEVALEEAERQMSSVLNLSSLEMEDIPQKLCERNRMFEKRVHRVYLQNNCLSTLPASWGLLLPNLRSLALDHNVFTRLPDSCVLMNQLTFLNISHNDFSQEGFPLVICRLRNLRTLWANGIGIKEIPQEIGKLKKLEVLGLRHNEISELPRQFWGLQSLIRLSLSDNRFLEFPEYISSLITLVHLNMDDNLISQLPQNLKDLTELRYVSLKKNCLGVTAEALQRLRSILKLKWCQLDGNPKLNAPAQQFNKGKFKPVEVLLQSIESDVVGEQPSDANSSATPIHNVQTNSKGPNYSHSLPNFGSETVDIDRYGQTGELRFGLFGDSGGGGNVRQPGFSESSCTDLINPSEIREQSEPVERHFGEIMSDGGQCTCTDTENQGSDISESRVRSWLISTQQYLDLDAVNGNGDRIDITSSESEVDEYEQTVLHLTPELVEDDVNRMLIDLDASDLEHSPRSSEIDDLDRASSHSSYNSDYDEWAVDARDISLIIPRII